jgi:protein phosphatase
VTDIGNIRGNNEDTYALSEDGSLWIVADGMGGHAAGEVASAITVQTILASMNPGAPPAIAESGGDVCDRLIQAFANAQHAVLSRSREDAECRSMGSAAIAAIVDGDALHICHVGDVRAYHLSGRRFRRVTNDHSWVWQNLVVSGVVAPDRVRSHPLRSNLMQAIGGPHGCAPDLASIALQDGDRVLLCSDGLWEALSDAEIGASVASAGSMQRLASALVERANAASGKDNITLVLYQHSGS